MDNYDADRLSDIEAAYDSHSGGESSRSDSGRSPVAGIDDPITRYWRGEHERHGGQGARERRERGERNADHYRAEHKARQRERAEETRGSEGWRAEVSAMRKRRDEAPAGHALKSYEGDLDHDIRMAMVESRGRRSERDSIAHYHEKAAGSGTTLAAALDRYVGFEEMVRADPLTGLVAIARQAGVPLNAAAEYFQALQGGIGALFPAGERAIADRHTARAAGFMDDSHRVHHAIHSAAANLPGFASMEGDIAALFESGAVPRTANPEQDLLNAYHAVASGRQRERAHAERARRASRSISGSTVGAGGGRRGSRGDIEADVRAAYDQLAGGY